LNINLTNTPYISPPVKAETPAPASQDASQNKVIAERLSNQAVQAPNQNDKNARLAYSKERITSFSDNNDDERQSIKAPIAQYQETENLPKRQELESLVGLDLFA